MIDSNAIMQEMIDNHESCRIISDENGTTAKLRPSVISELLKDKLSDSDILDGARIVNRQIALSNIKTNLYRQCSNTNCIVKDKCVFRAIPNGNTNADVMFLNKMPTEYEMANMTSHCDRNGVFLSLVLDKMNVSRDCIYCTDMIKCNAQLNEESYKECLQEYIMKEMECISPKIIICNGLSVLKACVKNNLLQHILPEDIAYGKIYNATLPSGTETKVIAIYDLDTVLKKTGDDYVACKTGLWSQIMSAFRSLLV